MEMNTLLIPALAHMLLIFALYIMLGIRKSAAVKAGLVDRKEASLNANAWPESVVKISNCIANQFEAPVLFYALTFMLVFTGHVNGVIFGLLSLFVFSRYWHAYIHVTSNYVPHRMGAFIIGVVILLLLAVWLTYNVVSTFF